MKNDEQIKDFMNRYDIKNELLVSFQNLLKANSAQDLNLTNKNISINQNQILYRLTQLNFHSFQIQISEDQKEIGYYALVFADNGQLVDEHFVVF